MARATSTLALNKLSPQVIPYSRPELEAELPDVLKGGDVVSLFHTEIEANICHIAHSSHHQIREAPIAENIFGATKVSECNTPVLYLQP